MQPTAAFDEESPPLAAPVKIPTMWTVSQLKAGPAKAGRPPRVESHWMFIQWRFAQEKPLVLKRAQETKEISIIYFLSDILCLRESEEVWAEMRSNNHTVKKKK